MQDLPEERAEDLKLRKIFCEFAVATILASLGRSEDNIEFEAQYYQDLRKHVESFETLVFERLDSVNEVQEQDLLQKLAILLTYDFEAACKLKDFPNMGEIIVKAFACKSMRVYQLMADCLLCSHATTPGTFPIYHSLR
jgi:hypothetical protein